MTIAVDLFKFILTNDLARFFVFFFFRMWFHRPFRADDWLLFVVGVK